MRHCILYFSPEFAFGESRKMFDVIHGKTDPEVGSIRYCRELFSKEFALFWIQVFSFTDILGPFGNHQAYLLRNILQFVLVVTIQMNYSVVPL